MLYPTDQGMKWLTADCSVMARGFIRKDKFQCFPLQVRMLSQTLNLLWEVEGATFMTSPFCIGMLTAFRPCLEQIWAKFVLMQL